MSGLRKTLLLAAALATAGLLYMAVAHNDGGAPLVPPRRDDRLATLGILAFGFAGLIAVPGAVLTFFYLRRPHGWLRAVYHVLLFLTVLTNVLVFATDARVFASMFCWSCGLEMWWTQTIVPASLYVVLAPPVASFLAREPVWQRTQQRVQHRAVLLRDGVTDSLLSEPAPAATFPRVTLWLAAVPWLSLLAGRLMLTVGSQILLIPIVYAAAFYATLIVTPVLGYLAVRHLRNMPGAAKVWILAGLLAGVMGWMDAAGAFSMAM